MSAVIFMNLGQAAFAIAYTACPNNTIRNFFMVFTQLNESGNLLKCTPYLVGTVKQLKALFWSHAYWDIQLLNNVRALTLRICQRDDKNNYVNLIL